MFCHVLWLVAECHTLTTESSAVQKDVHLLHELNPELRRVWVEGRHKSLNTACLYLVGLADLHREHGPSLTQHFPQGGNFVPLGCSVLASAFRLGCVYLNGVVLVLDVCNDLGCGIDSIVRLIPFDTTKLGKNPILIRE